MSRGPSDQDQTRPGGGEVDPTLILPGSGQGRAASQDGAPESRSMEMLALIRKDQKRFSEAERMMRETLELRRRLLGPNHPDTANAKYDLACILALAGKRPAALELIRDSIEHGLNAASAGTIGEDSDFAPLHGDPRF